jgi:hypothetical protein
MKWEKEPGKIRKEEEGCDGEKCERFDMKREKEPGKTRNEEEGCD